MSKNTNLSFLTDFITADIVNSRVGINNASPQTTFDVTGTGKFSGILTLGSTISNGTYAYTLPSATGTLALTSDIPSVTGYVPYTGATQAVNLGYNSLSASFLRIDGAGPTLGSYLGFKHSTNVTTGADGYTSIYTFGTNTIAFKSVSGATTRDFSFSMASITPGVPGGRTYTLPDADGTIALTSNIPANPVGGTGTSGTIPVFTGSTTIGNSIIQSNATQVNIVGNGSQLLFDSLGQSKSGGIQYTNSFDLLINNSRGSGSAIFLGNVNMDFHTNVSGNPRLRITDGGNVLIGTTDNNGAKLQVNGGVTITNSAGGFTASNYLQIEGSTANNTNYPGILFKGGTLVTTYPSIELSNGGVALVLNQGFSASLPNTSSISLNNGAITLSTGSTLSPRLTVNELGNVGIGETSPAVKLHIVGTTQMRLDATSSGSIIQFWKDSSASFASSIGNSIPGGSVTNDLLFSTYNGSLWSERMRIASTGATTFSSSVTTGSTLQANGNAFILPTLIGGGAGGGLYLGVYPDTQYTKQAILVERYVGVLGNYGRGSLHFCNRDTADSNQPTLADSRMVITSGGNIGIGTNNPDGQLSGTKGLSIVHATNAAVGLSNGANHWLNYLSGTTYRIWNNSVSEVMTLTYSGNVLIGTTTDSGSKLRVSGGSLQIDGGFQRMYTYVIVVNPSSTGTITISSPTGTNMQGSMQVMAGGYGNGLTGNVTGLWLVGGLLFFDNAGTSTITQIVNSVTNFGSMSFQRSGDQYTVSLANTASSGGSTKSFYVSVIINGS